MADKYEAKAMSAKATKEAAKSLCGTSRTREFLSPEIASAWLKKNYSKNRSITKSAVMKYKTDILNNDWVEYLSEAIIFDENDQLINGQHRCAAVVAAQKGIWVDVVRGAKESDYQVIDCGKARTTADSMRDYLYPTALAGLVNSLIRYEEYEMENPYTGQTNHPVSAQQAMEYLHSYDVGDYPADNRLIPYLRLSSMAKSNGLLGSGAIALVYKVASDAHPDEALEFFSQLVSGEGVFLRGQPVYTLRSKLIRARQGNEKPTNITMFGWIVKAWNAYIQGKPCKSLSYTCGKDKLSAIL